MELHKNGKVTAKITKSQCGKFVAQLYGAQFGMICIFSTAAEARKWAELETGHND